MKENPYSEEDIEYMNLQWALMTKKQRKAWVRDSNNEVSPLPGACIVGLLLTIFVFHSHPVWIISFVCCVILCYALCKKFQKPVHVETLQELRERVLRTRYAEYFCSGEVSSHRHVNPDGMLGGVVADTAYVAATSFVHPYAFVCDNAKVLGNSFVSKWSVLKGDIEISDTISKEFKINLKDVTSY